jgi:hypothetical protein
MPSHESTLEIRSVKSSPSVSDLSEATQSEAAGPSARTHNNSERMTTYEFIDSRELARRLAVPISWIRDQVRARSRDPLPHINLGKYVRFLWGSRDLEDWVARRIVKGNNRRVERVR